MLGTAVALASLPAGAQHDGNLEQRLHADLVIVRPSGLLDALIALFENLWRMALPLQFSSDEEVGLPSLDEPGHDELRLLSLLATGLPDSTIAARLGISHRTYQRRLRSLLDRLGAQTCFQAGIQATRRGWI
jgi:DNA-binding NarL/FixJ family response regulator